MSKRFSFKASCQKISSSLTALATLTNLFFPYACFGCGQNATWLCESCQNRIPFFFTQRCFLCYKNVTRYGEACFQCDIHTHPLDAVFSAACYQVPVIKRMIHSYKYQFVKNLALPLGKFLAKSIEKSALPLPDIIIPVPLHSKRLRYRGFNQSALLAKVLTEEVATLNNTQVSPYLQRTRFTQPQQKTGSKSERATNLTNAFSVTLGTDVTNKVIWLLDDVATTKSTLAECARVLKETGAKKVYAVVLAQD